MIWFANVREVASESSAEAVIRFGISVDEVQRLQRATWTYWMTVLDGRADHRLVFDIRPGLTVGLTPRHNDMEVRHGR